MAWCVSGGFDGHDASVIAERPASGKRSEWSAFEYEGLGGEPRREWLTQDPTHDPRDRRSDRPQLGLVEQYACAQVNQPVDVVAMSVREYDLGDVVELQT